MCLKGDLVPGLNQDLFSRLPEREKNSPDWITKAFFFINTINQFLNVLRILPKDMIIYIYIKIHAMSFCHSVLLSFFSTPFPWTNLTAKYIYGFLLKRQKYSDHLKIDMWEFFKKFYLSYSEKCPSEHNAMCPSEHNTQKVSFRTEFLKKCPSEQNS